MHYAGTRFSLSRSGTGRVSVDQHAVRDLRIYKSTQAGRRHAACDWPLPNASIDSADCRARSCALLGTELSDASIISSTELLPRPHSLHSTVGLELLAEFQSISTIAMVEYASPYFRHPSSCRAMTSSNASDWLSYTHRGLWHIPRQYANRTKRSIDLIRQGRSPDNAPPCCADASVAGLRY